MQYSPKYLDFLGEIISKKYGCKKKEYARFYIILNFF